MAFAPNNPNGMCFGMDISIGAMKSEAKKAKKSAKTPEGFVLGEMEFFHGILPQWKFIDEKYFDRWEKKQILHKQRLAEITKRRTDNELETFKYEHNHLLCLAGPEWYQELSPQQKEIVDNLKIAMKKDLDLHLTRASQSSLSLLGMRPLPNDSQLWKALKDSLGCPIEFCLVLYQLIKPQRKYYSINDRLLLSAVAHLSLRDTLREMHIRYPSPPRAEKTPPPPKRKPRKKKYGHVYLIPFTFKWPIRRSNLYRNPVIQKPECPYFSYVCDLEKERVMCNDNSEQTERADEDIKIPCELFNDHLEAEEFYNWVFKREDSCKYTILRPHIYESSTPKTYPGILPKFMVKKRYPPLIRLTFDVKIYNEINLKNQKKRKIIRTICEARAIPAGRAGQKMGENLIAKYVYIKNIGAYLRKNVESTVQEEDSDEGGDYPCSICGGPEGKQRIPETKPVKVKSWIKRPRLKKRKRVFLQRFSDSMDKDKKEENVVLDEETLRLREENKKYIAAWEKLFDNIERMEKLKLETEKCVCPTKTKDKTKLDPENDCTCAIWNLIPPPKPIPPKISCECEPIIEEEYIPPKEDKCDCKQKAREKALAACERCGKPREKTEEEKAAEGVCACLERLDACGNCVKQVPMKFPLMEGETKKECECKPEPPKEGQEVTVAYVFVDNKLANQKSQASKDDCDCSNVKKSSKKEDFSSRDKKQTLNATTSVKDKEKNKKKEKGSEKLKVRVDDYKKKNDSDKNKEDKDIKKQKENSRDQKLNKKKIECLLTCGKLLELDHCQRETAKLLNMLKCSCPKCRDLRKRYRSKFIQASTRDGCGGILPVIGGTYGLEKECDCLDKFEERVRGVKDYTKRMKAKMDLKSQQDRYIINGVQQTYNGPVYNLAGVVPKKPCSCKTSNEVLIEKKKQEKVTEKIKDDHKFIISGVKEGSEENEYIIGGVTKECECTDVYMKFMEEHNECLVSYEKYLKNMEKEINAYMQDMKERYKNPPLTAKKLVEGEIRRMMGAPGLHIPEGKSEFVVSGVQANNLGKSFILGGILLNQEESDECTIAVESYTHLADGKDSSKCERVYLCNYMTFGRNCGNPFQPSRETEIKNSSEELVCQCISYESLETGSTEECQDEEEELLDGCACECPCGVEIDRPEDCSCAMPAESEESCICAELGEEEEDEQEIEAPEGCTCGDVEIKSSGPATDPCLCGFKNCGCQVDNVCVKECFYGPMEAWWSESDFEKQRGEETEKAEEEEKEPEETKESVESISPIGGPSKRYVILRAVPKRTRTQDEVLQKLLTGLADDGFPLAKLPESYKIPYFRLWMQFRMRKQWNYDDALKNFRSCQTLWNHIDICRRKVPPPKLPVFCGCDAANYTWREAYTVAKMVRDTKQKFYDRVRKNMVNYAREFYATLSAYRYPNPPYLNHYFYAYQPGKVENCIAERVWQGSEHKNPKDYKSCFCK